MPLLYSPLPRQASLRSNRTSDGRVQAPGQDPAQRCDIPRWNVVMASQSLAIQYRNGRRRSRFADIFAEIGRTQSKGTNCRVRIETTPEDRSLSIASTSNHILPTSPSGGHSTERGVWVIPGGEGDSSPIPDEYRGLLQSHDAVMRRLSSVLRSASSRVNNSADQRTTSSRPCTSASLRSSRGEGDDTVGLSSDSIDPFRVQNGLQQPHTQANRYRHNETGVSHPTASDMATQCCAFQHTALGQTRHWADMQQPRTRTASQRHIHARGRAP
ncbi:hypothetical protein CLAIMM_08339 isoform 1, partial [Cladophialophora immunda]